MFSIFLAVIHKLFLLGENKGPEGLGRKTSKFGLKESKAQDKII
jgi:hypothetical protein